MIPLPVLFEDTLGKSPELHAAVHKNLGLFEPWLEQSGMPFFPGFTDHSPRHIRDVLETAASLVSDQSRDLLSPEDVAVLCMSILLHDCGMHLTQDGFRALVARTEPALISGLQDRPWQQIWNDFLAEAGRFGQEKLVAIFGDADPLNLAEFRIDDLSERDCLLVGEFVRRHHARLAHEIALQGVPRQSGAPLELVGLDSEMRDLAGLIARSHGMSIRSTFPYIEGRYSLVPEFRKIKTPYLMAVLRIADYVQVQSERALKSLLSVKELRSPVSRQEWRNHFAVRDVSAMHADPEVLHVHAAPTDVRTYLKLAALFKDIQRELDESWATIGEVYGRRGNLSALGLSWRRIRSNLDKHDQFAKTVSYIPIKAGFEASGPDLLKLLVGPLYDYSSTVGIRELVQNAVDACRELADLSEKESRNLQTTSDYEVLVDFQESDDGTGWITVSDRGVGMTLETVTKYFLVAGASFRNSDVWKRQHMDESGRSRVHRGGRFGVGALAAFLLGDEIKVETRHIDRQDGEGLEFNARMDEPIVELRRCSLPHGTSIRILVTDRRVFDALRPYVPESMVQELRTEEVINLNDWSAVDWFAQAHPRVKYVWSGFDSDEDHHYRKKQRVKAEYVSSSKAVVPSFDGPIGDWHALPVPAPYSAILWKYTFKQDDPSIDSRISTSEVTVNGIRVEKIGTDKNWYVDIADESKKFGPRYIVKRPSMAIFDPAGICPINLQRSAIAFDKMGVDDYLGKDIILHYFQLLAVEARECKTVLDFQRLCVKLAKQETVTYHGFVSPICATSRGITLNSLPLLSELEIENLIFVDSVDEAAVATLSGVLGDEDALFFRQKGGGVANDLSWFRGFFGPSADYMWYSSQAGFPLVSHRGAVSVMPTKKWKAASEKGKVNRQILESLESKAHRKDFQLVVSGNAKQAEHVIPRIDRLLDVFGKNSEVSIWTIREEQQLPAEPPLLEKLWLSSVGNVVCK
ncbi:HD domain-containing protein [Paraburkholderia sp. GAS348]|uniref:HD domain-containing protein n=1 Tax=Paraburkholderia sp. GAS348 TaxID=3035132 RepID=UPI003D24E1E9